MRQHWREGTTGEMSGKSVVFIVGLGLVALFSLFNGKSETYSDDGFGMFGRVEISCPNGFRGEPTAKFDDPYEQEVFDEAQTYGLDPFSFEGESIDEVCSGSQLRSWFWFFVFGTAAFAVYWAQRPGTKKTNPWAAVKSDPWSGVRDRISAVMLDIPATPPPAQPQGRVQPRPPGAAAPPPGTHSAKPTDDAPKSPTVSQAPNKPEVSECPQTEPALTATASVSPSDGRATAVPQMVAVAHVEGGPTFRFENWIAIGREPTAPDSARNAELGAVPDTTFTLSKTHALLGFNNGEIWVEDLHSTNGTMIVGADSSLSLQPDIRYVVGDSGAVRLGDVLINVRVEGNQ